MIGPTLIVHGSDEQKRLPKIVSSEVAWAEGYSEPVPVRTWRRRNARHAKRVLPRLGKVRAGDNLSVSTSSSSTHRMPVTR